MGKDFRDKIKRQRADLERTANIGTEAQRAVAHTRLRHLEASRLTHKGEAAALARWLRVPILLEDPSATVPDFVERALFRPVPEDERQRRAARNSKIDRPLQGRDLLGVHVAVDPWSRAVERATRRP